MRVTIPADRARVLRHNVTANTKLIVRNHNGNKTYFVVHNGYALHIGRSKRYMQHAFNLYTIPYYDEVRYLSAN